jgi:hypothetical protein
MRGNPGRRFVTRIKAFDEDGYELDILFHGVFAWNSSKSQHY